MPKDALFVYGTLHPDHAPREISRDVKRLISIGQGTIRGELRQMGEYPAVRLRKNAQDKVKGTVFELPDDPGLLARLDGYEEYKPDDPEGSLFVRLQVPVTFLDGSQRNCWVYVYNK